MEVGTRVWKTPYLLSVRPTTPLLVIYHKKTRSESLHGYHCMEMSDAPTAMQKWITIHNLVMDMTVKTDDVMKTDTV